MITASKTHTSIRACHTPPLINIQERKGFIIDCSCPLNRSTGNDSRNNNSDADTNRCKLKCGDDACDEGLGSASIHSECELSPPMSVKAHTSKTLNSVSATEMQNCGKSPHSTLPLNETYNIPKLCTISRGNTLNSEAWNGFDRQNPDLNLDFDGLVFDGDGNSLTSADDSNFDIEGNPLTSSVSHSPDSRQLPVQYADKDVLLGRGGMTNKHPGNQNFRDFVEQVKPMYSDCRTKAKKKEVSQLVVDWIHSNGGKFLKRFKKDINSANEWVIAKPDEARKKASQALREARSKTLKKVLCRIPV